MKSGLMLILLVTCNLSWAQTLKEKRIKQEMLDRVDVMLEKIGETQADLEREDAVNACKKINELFVIYPDHVKAIGGHMDLFSSKTINAKNEALGQLIFFHRTKLTCEQGKESEYIDPTQISKELKKIEKSLNKQKKIIKKSDTDYENDFYYQYEF